MKGYTAFRTAPDRIKETIYRRKISYSTLFEMKIGVKVIFRPAMILMFHLWMILELRYRNDKDILGQYQEITNGE